MPSMNGTSAQDGKRLSGIDHLRQSVRDILTTPIGSRIMRREYGSRVFEFVDAPINQSTVVGIIAAAAEALYRWEPRLLVEHIGVAKVSPGVIELSITGQYLPDGQRVTLDGITVQ